MLQLMAAKDKSRRLLWSTLNLMAGLSDVGSTVKWTDLTELRQILGEMAGTALSDLRGFEKASEGHIGPQI